MGAPLLVCAIVVGLGCVIGAVVASARRGRSQPSSPASSRSRSAAASSLSTATRSIAAPSSAESPAGAATTSHTHSARTREAGAADAVNRELQTHAPHLFTLPKLPGAAEGLQLPAVEHADAAAAELRTWVRDTSTRVGKRTEMMREIERAGWDPRALADLVQSDPLLAGAVLKITNSGYYSLRQRAASVLQAVLLLGVVEVRNIIWRTCVSETLGLDRHPARAVIDGVWAHSFDVSRTAYAIAKKSGHPRPDEIATAGLLHDVGKIVFLAADPERSRGLYDDVPHSEHTRLRHEIAEFGVTHSRMGATLAESWGLPGKAIATIALHHAPTYVDPRALEGPTREVAIVHAADLLAHIDPSGRIDEDAPAGPRPGWLEALGLGLERSTASDGADSGELTRPMDRPRRAA